MCCCNLYLSWQYCLSYEMPFKTQTMYFVVKTDSKLVSQSVFSLWSAQLGNLTSFIYFTEPNRGFPSCSNTTNTPPPPSSDSNDPHQRHDNDHPPSPPPSSDNNNNMTTTPPPLLMRAMRATCPHCHPTPHHHHDDHPLPTTIIGQCDHHHTTILDEGDKGNGPQPLLMP